MIVTMKQFIFCLVLLLKLSFITLDEGEIPTFVAKEGENVVLSCPVNTPECGDYHSLKWYRNTHRVYVYSPFAQFSNAENSLMDRCLDLSQRSLGPDCPRGRLDVSDTTADLEISPIKMSDDGQYRCEITYLDVTSNCPVVHFSNVTTVAPPSWVTMSVSGEDQDQPFAAGTRITASCTSGGGKPSPSFQWTLAGQEISGHSEAVGDDLEVTSEVSFVVDEVHDGAEIECWVQNEFSTEPLKAQFKLDVRVSVKSVNIDTETTVGEEGTKMTISCKAVGGPPNPLVSWTLPDENTDMMSDPIEYETSEITIAEEDSDTLEVISYISFMASKDLNNADVSCHAINEVMREPITDIVALDIMYVPEANIWEDNITAITGDEVIVECEIYSNPSDNVTVVWYHDDVVIDMEDQRYIAEEMEGEDDDREDDITATLVISGVTAQDAGVYHCLAENQIGSNISNGVVLDIYYPPSVYVVLSPEVIVEEDPYNVVILRCELANGHPGHLTNVTWYKDGVPINNHPFVSCDMSEYELSDDSELFSDTPADTIDDDTCRGESVVTLSLLDRYDSGDYSCHGTNEAGDGDISNFATLNVQYRPGVTEIVLEEEFLVKEGNASFTCYLEELGNPYAEQFLWKLGDEILEEVTVNLTLGSSSITLTNFGPESQQNLSCVGFNEIGEGETDIFHIDVYAPPHMMTKLPEVTTFVINQDSSVTLTCQVECDPICNINWNTGDYDDEDDITEDFIREDELIPEDDEYFSSMKSSITVPAETVVAFNMENFTVECVSDDNDFGDFVSSSTVVVVEYPPQNLTMSIDEIEANEDDQIDEIQCSAEGSPTPSYYWTFNNEVVAEGKVLVFSDPVKRTDAGDYNCHAANKHGEEVATLNIVVLYKPQCSVSFTLLQEEIVLHCQASAYPNDLTFWWEKANETFVEPVNNEEEDTHDLRIKLSNETYDLDNLSCHVSNSIGESDPCHAEVNLPLIVSRIEQQELLLIIIISAAAVAVLLLVAVAICYYCYKRGRVNKEQEKSDNNKTADDQPHSDKSFYENLPFQGLKSPPKKVINPKVTDDNLDYADADYKDLYVEGPKGYRKLPDNSKAAKNISRSDEKVNGL